ncbi:MAG: amidohydrolase family protein [Rubellimicrobium sp.]|nr:amidohydrolase family protein [Rubellimicrobium sp.]
MLTIVDPHIHLWDLATGLYPGLETPSDGFIGNNAPIARSYLPPEFLAEPGPGLRLGGAVHVEAFPTDPLAEARHLQEMARSFPVPLAIVAHADLSDPGVDAHLAALAALPAVRGIRQVVNRHPDPMLNYVARDFLQEGAWARGYARLAAHGLSFDLQLYPHQVPDAAAILAAHADVPVILNHAGMWADRGPSGWRQWKAGLRQLAALPQVSVKISGLGMLDTGWTVDSIRPLVLETLEIFGMERSMFASNFPVDKLFSTYPALWEAFDSITADLSAAERAALFAGNATRVYRLDAPVV